MDFLAGLAKSAGESATSNSGDKNDSSDLLSSAKLVAEAAQSQFSNQSENIDKPKVAGAAANLIDAASQYSKFDETQGFGKYVGQAGDYLRKYSASGTPAAADPATAADTPIADLTGSEAPPAPKTADSSAAPVAEPTTQQAAPDAAATDTISDNSSAPAAGGDDAGDYGKLAEGLLNKVGISDGSAQDYVNLAGDFLNQKSGSGDQPESGGFGGDLAKFAGGFLNK